MWFAAAIIGIIAIATGISILPGGTPQKSPPPAAAAPAPETTPAAPAPAQPPATR
jgi:hypothetical protein